MATRRQIDAARSTIKRAQVTARMARPFPPLPERPALEFRSAQQIYALASAHRIAGRAGMGKPELIAAIREAR